jgi:WD40 repeat protein
VTARSVEYVVRTISAQAHDGPVWPLVFAPGAADPVLLSSAVDGDCHLCLWDGSSGLLKWRYTGDVISEQGVRGIGFVTPEVEAPIVMAATMEGIHRWDGLTGRELPGSDAAQNRLMWGVSSVVVPDFGTLIVGGAQNGRLYMFDPQSGGLVKEPLRGHGTVINAVTVSMPTATGGIVVSGDEMGYLVRWDSRIGDWLGSPIKLDEEIMWLCAGSDVIAGSSVIVIADSVGDLHCWDVVSGHRVGKAISTGQGICDMTLVRLGDSLGVVAAGDNDMVRCWNALTGDFCGVIAHGTSVAARIVGGENLLAIGSADGKISFGTLARAVSL